MGLSRGTQALHCSVGASLVVAHRLLSSCGMRAPEREGSVVVAQGFSCPTACRILVPWWGIKPTSPALKGIFFTTGPPGKSLTVCLLMECLHHLYLMWNVDTVFAVCFLIAYSVTGVPFFLSFFLLNNWVF